MRKIKLSLLLVTFGLISLMVNASDVSVDDSDPCEFKYFGKEESLQECCGDLLINRLKSPEMAFESDEAAELFFHHLAIVGYRQTRQILDDQNDQNDQNGRMLRKYELPIIDELDVVLDYANVSLDNFMSFIAQNSGILTNLISFNMIVNNSDVDGIEILTSALKKYPKALENIKKLSVWMGNSSEKSIKDFTNFLRENPLALGNLRVLDLTWNQIGDDEAQHLIDFLVQNENILPKLIKLDLSDNKITDKCLSNIENLQTKRPRCVLVNNACFTTHIPDLDLF